MQRAYYGYQPSAYISPYSGYVEAKREVVQDV